MHLLVDILTIRIRMEHKTSRSEIWGGMDWIELAHDRDRWWALVNAVMNLQVP
jgi:hypothetical protein